MTTTIYWSPWYRDHKIYTENYLAYYDLEKVYVDLVKNKEERNIADNFFNCHAFKNFCKNLYSLKNPYTVDLIYEGERVFSKNPPKTGYDLSITSQVKHPSVKDSLTINYCTNWIFFADKPVQLQTMQPWMHKTQASKTSFYVPGSFDISKWFRPIEMACQLFPGENTFSSIEGEPLIYANFLTDEPIVLKKFYLTPELIDLSTSCTHLKFFKKFKSLNSLYKIFSTSLLQKKILKEIQKNVIEE
jgi:hypothetical protein